MSSNGRPSKRPTRRTRARRLAPAGVMLLVGVVACGAPSDRDVPVGRISLLFDDPERPSWIGEGPRPLAVVVWYPAVTGAREEPWNGGPFRFGRTAPGADPTDHPERFPMVLLSHGTGGSAAQLSWLAEHLASNGWLVVGVNHHGNTAAEPGYRPEGFVLWWERARDLSVVLDRILDDARFGHRVDTSRIAVAGYSVGGLSALLSVGARIDRDGWRRYCEGRPLDPACILPPEAPWSPDELEDAMATEPRWAESIERAGSSFRDSRIRAAFLLAPALVPALDPASLSRVTVPVGIIAGARDDQVLLDEHLSALAAGLGDHQMEILEGVGHYTFLARCGLRGRVMVRALCSDFRGTDRGETHRRAGTEVLAFLERSVPRGMFPLNPTTR